MLSCTALNLNNRLFPANVSFDSKIKTYGLIVSGCEHQKQFTFTYRLTGNLWIILIPTSRLQTVLKTNHHRKGRGNG